MRRLVRLFLLLNFLLLAGHGSVLAGLQVEAGSISVSASGTVAERILALPQAAVHSGFDFAVTYAPAIPEENFDKYYDTESEDESDELTYIRKLSGSSNYFSSFYSTNTGIGGHLDKAPFSDSNCRSRYSYERYIFYRAIRV